MPAAKVAYYVIYPVKGSKAKPAGKTQSIVKEFRVGDVPEHTYYRVALGVVMVLVMPTGLFTTIGLGETEENLYGRSKH